MRQPPWCEENVMKFNEIIFQLFRKRKNCNSFSLRLRGRTHTATLCFRFITRGNCAYTPPSPPHVQQNKQELCTINHFKEKKEEGEREEGGKGFIYKPIKYKWRGKK